MSYTRKQIDQAISEWQRRLRMQDWEFVVDWDGEPEGECALGSVKQVPGRKLAVIRLNKDRLEVASPAELSHIIAHELSHMILEPMGNAVDLALVGASAEKALLVRRLACYANEIVTDAIAAAFCLAYGPPGCLRATE